MIDLHTHTNLSDGELSPPQLVEHASALGLQALAITDHDTMEGCEQAAPHAAAAGLEMVGGVELSTRLSHQPRAARDAKKPRTPSVHLLGYFLNGPASEEFRRWLLQMQESRRQRNTKLIAKLQSLGVDITLEEVRVYGWHQTARPHFAQVLLKKGYVSSIQKAFDHYLGDDARAAVPRDEPCLDEGIQRIRSAGGLAALAHPVRLSFGRDRDAFEKLVRELVDVGMEGIEVYHSEHTESDVELYLSIAKKFGLCVTGGSDFHGENNKPGVRLAKGQNSSLFLPYQLLEQMRRRK